jgi:hypothetical protein
MCNLTKSDEQFVEKRVAEKHQQLMEELIIANRENGCEEYSDKELADVVCSALSGYYWNAVECWQSLAYRYRAEDNVEQEERAWKRMNMAYYAYYIAFTKYKMQPQMPPNERKGRTTDSWLLRD